MESEAFVVPASIFIFIFIVFCTTMLSWFTARWLLGRLPGVAIAAISGFGPLIIIIAGLALWHFVEFSAYQASGSQDGFMGPLLILLYGFPYFVIMVFLNLAAAILAVARK
jgi:hypothetical protein